MTPVKRSAWDGKTFTRAEIVASDKPRVYRLRDLVSAGELAKALGVSVETVLEWRRNNGLPGYRIGKRVYFLESEFMDWIRESLRIRG